MASLLVHTLAGRRNGARRRCVYGAAGARLPAAAAALGRALLDEVREKQRAGLKATGAWVHARLSWTTRKRLATRLFRGEALRAAAGLMGPADAGRQFRDVFGAIVVLTCGGRDVGAARRMQCTFWQPSVACSPGLGWMLSGDRRVRRHEHQ